jgi:hypothetical protein
MAKMEDRKSNCISIIPLQEMKTQFSLHVNDRIAYNQISNKKIKWCKKIKLTNTMADDNKL